MRLDRPPSDGQPEAHPTEITRSGLVDSIEAIEDALTMLGPYARPRVDDVDGRRWSSVPHDDPDLATWRGILDGIVHQVDERLSDHEAIHRCRDRFRRVDGERLLLLLGEHTEVSRHIASELGEIDTRKSQ